MEHFQASSMELQRHLEQLKSAFARSYLAIPPEVGKPANASVCTDAVAPLTAATLQVQSPFVALHLQHHHREELQLLAQRLLLRQAQFAALAAAAREIQQEACAALRRQEQEEVVDDACSVLIEQQGALHSFCQRVMPVGCRPAACITGDGYPWYTMWPGHTTLAQQHHQ